MNEQVQRFGPLFETSSAPTLASARAAYWRDLREGTTCPCCDRYGKIYRRKFTSAMARLMIALEQANRRRPGRWVHVVTEIPYEQRSGDYAKPILWGLVEAKKGAKEGDGNPEIGFYRITGKGVAFVRGKITIPRFKFVYHDRLVEIGEIAPEIGIRDALSAKFNYEELMAE